MTGFRIINGRLRDVGNIGNFTCHTQAGSSTVGYCLTREGNFDLIENFQIEDINTISDHAYLHLRLKIVVANQHKSKDISGLAQ